MLSVVIPSWNGRGHLQNCLESLYAQQEPGQPWEVLVWDNGSRDGTSAWLASSWPRVRCLSSSGNLGFAEAVNRLVAAAAGDWVALLNNDTRVRPDWLLRFAEGAAAAGPEVAALAGRMLNWDGALVDFAGGVMTFDGHAFQVGQGRPVASRSEPPAGTPLLFGCGANMLVRRAHFLESGGLDAEYFAYYEDVDLGWRTWSRGWQVLYWPQATVYHRGSASLSQLGLFHRGYLFERNALVTVLKNYDAEFYGRLIPSVLLTFQSRVDHLLRERNPGVRGLLGYAMPARNPLGRLLRALGLGSRWGLLADRGSLAHLRAQNWLGDNLDSVMARREQVQRQRRRSDREIFERFPLQVVPTYPGDAGLFAGSGFRAGLEGMPLAWP